MRFHSALLVTLAFACFFSGAEARTWLVRPDGSGDAPTIQAAVDSSADDDVVELADGTFTGTGNRDIDLRDRSITVRSASGSADLCIVDCEGTPTEPHRGFVFGAVSKRGASLERVTVTGGCVSQEPWGSAVLCEGGSAPSILACVFRGNGGSAVGCIEQAAPTIEECEFRNNSGERGGALRIRWARPVVRRCTFREDESEDTGGAVHSYVGRPVFDACTFVGNTSALGGAIDVLVGNTLTCTGCLFLDNVAGRVGAINALICSTYVEECVFVGNQALESWAGAIAFGKTSYTWIDGSTFWGNGGPDGTLLCGEYGATITNTIIAGSTRGPSIAVGGNVTLSCCDLFGNAGGDWVVGIADQEGIRGNFAADPLFCDPENGDLTLRSDSPCLPGNHPGGAACGLIGALGEGCAPPTAVERASWGGVKTRFR
jgi:hypothetical protein